MSRSARDQAARRAHVELIEDPRTGDGRPWLIEIYLGRFRDLADRAVPVLRRLLADDDLGRYALKPLGRLRAVEALTQVERFLTHERDWVRTDAKRVLKTFESIQFESWFEGVDKRGEPGVGSRRRTGERGKTS